jgi:hypothetical protein
MYYYKYVKRKLLIGALKSDYAKRTYDFLPTWLVSYALRLIVDFMLYYRLRVDYYLLNMLIAVLVSTSVTMCSPLFYDLVWQYEERIQKFTNHVADHMSWKYYYKWQTRIVLGTSLILIIILTQFSITSVWLIECIIHTLVCGYILSKYDEWRDYYSKPALVFCERFDTNDDIRKIIYVKSGLRHVKICTTDIGESIIEDYKQPLHATIVTKFITKNVSKSIVKTKNINLNMFIIENYVPK